MSELALENRAEAVKPITQNTATSLLEKITEKVKTSPKKTGEFFAKDTYGKKIRLTVTQDKSNLRENQVAIVSIFDKKTDSTTRKYFLEEGDDGIQLKSYSPDLYPQIKIEEGDSHEVFEEKMRDYELQRRDDEEEALSTVSEKEGEELLALLKQSKEKEKMWKRIFKR